VIAAVLALAGVLAIGAGVALLVRLGTAWRIGRLLAAAPVVELAEVARMAREGEAAYVRTHGRVSSDEEFPDENQRPLVYRRRRLQHADGRGGWRTFDDDRVAVPFGLEDRQTYVGVDTDALGDGLVAVPREALGTFAEIPSGAGPSALPAMPPDTPVRLVIEQVSAVEHASAAGVPALGPDGEPWMSAGLGRPLIVTSLEPSAAMRVLAAGHRTATRLAAVLLVTGPALLAAAALAALAGL
jgi:hypothetical protein